MTNETVLERVLRSRRAPGQEPSELEQILKEHREYAEKWLKEVEAKLAELESDDVAQD